MLCSPEWECWRMRFNRKQQLHVILNGNQISKQPQKSKDIPPGNYECCANCANPHGVCEHFSNQVKTVTNWLHCDEVGGSTSAGLIPCLPWICALDFILMHPVLEAKRLNWFSSVTWSPKGFWKSILNLCFDIMNGEIYCTPLNTDSSSPHIVKRRLWGIVLCFYTPSSSSTS